MQFKVAEIGKKMKKITSILVPCKSKWQRPEPVSGTNSLYHANVQPTIQK